MQIRTHTSLVLFTVFGLFGGLAAAPPSPPIVIGADHIVVEAPGARAVIQRDPFNISFQDPATGTTVLEQVPGSGLPAAVANVEPEPGGIDLLPETSAAAPLSYVVGVDRSAQQPAGLWTGNMITGAWGGIVHHATAVTAAVPLDDGVRLTVATTEPGRSLVVDVLPDMGSAVRVVVAPNRTAGISGFGDAFVSGPDEAFHGFGGRRNDLDQRGHDFYAWVEEENMGAGPLQPVIDPVPGSGGAHYEFPNGQHAAYYVQNLFVSSRPYGFLLNTTDLTRWRMAADAEDVWQVGTRDDHLDYTVAVGDGPTAIDALTRINGRHRVNPAWAMGPMLKRNVQQGSENAASYEAKIRADLAAIEEHDLAGLLSAYAYEGWDGLDRGFIREVNDWLRARDIRPVGYVRAYVNDDGMFDRPGTFGDAVSKGLVAMTPGGAPFVSVAVGPAALLDFTNPATVAWWAERKILEMLDLGFDGFMQDFGEQVLDDMVFHDGSTGEAMHNAYPTLFHQTTRQLLDEYEERHPERGELWMYTRAGFSGRQGSAAYESANFPGDETTDWQQSTGLPSLAADMLNRSVGGAYGYTTDIGGYFDTFTSDTLDDELFARWSQWSALTPFYRLHNSCCNGTRMPWDFGPEAFATWRAYAELHAAAIPTIREAWQQAVDTGMPVVRPMWLVAPDDPAAAEYDQQWLLGDDVLVAPVVTKGARQREVYLPEGAWVRPDTGERFTGPAVVEVAADLDQLPWFVRRGTPRWW